VKSKSERANFKIQDATPKPDLPLGEPRETALKKMSEQLNNWKIGSSKR
jgi:hypothetical protein